MKSEAVTVMKTAHMYEAPEYADDKPLMKVLLDHVSTKELRIMLRKGQVMKEHQTPFPIVIHIIEGTADLGLGQVKERLLKGSLVALEPHVPHDLSAVEDTMIRLSLHKGDAPERVQEVMENS